MTRESETQREMIGNCFELLIASRVTAAQSVGTSFQHAPVL